MSDEKLAQGFDPEALGLVKLEGVAAERFAAGGRFGHDQDRIRMALEAVAEDPETEARAPGSREILEELALGLWTWIDDLDLEITGDQPAQDPLQKTQALRTWLADVARVGLDPNLERDE